MSRTSSRLGGFPGPCWGGAAAGEGVCQRVQCSSRGVGQAPGLAVCAAGAAGQRSPRAAHVQPRPGGSRSAAVTEAPRQEAAGGTTHGDPSRLFPRAWAPEPATADTGPEPCPGCSSLPRPVPVKTLVPRYPWLRTTAEHCWEQAGRAWKTPVPTFSAPDSSRAAGSLPAGCSVEGGVWGWMWGRERPLRSGPLCGWRRSKGKTAVVGLVQARRGSAPFFWIQELRPQGEARSEGALLTARAPDAQALLRGVAPSSDRSA